MTARRVATALGTGYPSIAWGHGLEAALFYLAILGILALVFGLVAGGVSASRNWHPIKSFAAALGLFVLMATAPELFSGQASLNKVLGGLLFVAVVATIPVGVGHAAGRKIVGLRARRSLERRQEDNA